MTADAAAQALVPKDQLEVYARDGEADLAVTAGGSRIRVNVFRQQGHTALALRLLPLEVPTAGKLKLPQVLVQQAEKPRRMGVRECYEPFMTLVFLSLAVIPKLKLTDRGLFDLEKYSFVPLEEPRRG